MKFLKTLSILTLAGVLITSCGESKKENNESESMTQETEQTATEKEMAMSETPQRPNIVEVAVGNENFTTLVAALKAADLVGSLNGEGPFTVFAPTNDAFDRLPDGTVETLLKPENKGKLSGILTYHVVSGKYEAAAVIDAIKKNDGKFNVSTLNGGNITLSLKDGNVMLSDASGGTSTVIMADVAASNGVIHAIDNVVMPQ